MSVDVSKALGKVISDKEFHFTNEICMLYALAIGFNRDPLNEEEFKFTYELDDDYTTFSTMAVLGITTFGYELLQLPGFPPYDPSSLLHGEQILEIKQPVVPDTIARCVATIEDVADKGKGTVLTIRLDITDKDTQELLAIGYMRFFIKGLGGFGYKGTFATNYSEIPDRTPDEIAECPTDKNQALIYRLCGDINSLHVDPNIASMVGFEAPILHGLCTYGIVARAIYTQYCDGDPSLIKSVNSRFTSHVYPGETIVVEMYKEGSKVIFSAKTKERELQVCIGFVEITGSSKL